MRVAILADFAVPSGGAEKVALESARALAEAGVDVAYLHAVGEGGDTLLDHPRIRRVGLGLDDVWAKPAWRGAAEGVWNAEAARALGRALQALPGPAPDLVHLHQWTRSLSPAVLDLLLDRGGPVAVTLHDYFLACPNGVYYRFDRDEPCTFKPLSGACLAAPCDPRSALHKLVRVARSAVTSRLIRRGTLDLVHVSDRSRAVLEGLLADLPVRHHRVDNPVRAVRRAPARPGQGEVIAYIGRLTREKGADLVAAAAREAGLPALLIGSGPLEAELAAMPGVELLGWQSPEAVADILRTRVRALAAPSRWLETGPLTVYEALAAGVPVVASARSGAAEKVVDEVTGFVAEPTPGALAACFRRLRDPALAARMGAAAYERYWAAPLDAGLHARRLIDLYAAMIAGRAVPLSAERRIASR